MKNQGDYIVGLWPNWRKANLQELMDRMKIGDQVRLVFGLYGQYDPGLNWGYLEATENGFQYFEGKFPLENPEYLTSRGIQIIPFK